MALYEKNIAIEFDDADLLVICTPDPDDTVTLSVAVPDNDPNNPNNPTGPWASILTQAERSALGPILKKIARWGLTQKGYSAKP